MRAVRFIVTAKFNTWRNADVSLGVGTKAVWKHPFLRGDTALEPR